MMADGQLSKAQEQVVVWLARADLLEKMGGREAIARTQGETTSKILECLFGNQIPQPYLQGLLRSLGDDTMHVQGTTVIATVGHGSFGTVHCGWNWERSSPAALKFYYGPRSNADGQGIAEQAAQQEATMLRKLTETRTGEPSIVPDFLFTTRRGNVPVIGMQYSDGVSEEGVLNDWKPTSVAYAVHALAEEAALLTRLHAEHGVMHRDIKPLNILLNVRDGIRHLCDLHASTTVVQADQMMERRKQADDLEALGYRGFSIDYASLEQLQGVIDMPADIHALGVIAFERVSGYLPTQTIVGFNQIAMKKAQGLSKENLRDLRRSAPRPIADFIERMLAPKADQRPTADSCRDFFEWWNVHYNSRLLPLDKADAIRQDATRYRTLTVHERRLRVSLSTGGTEDPLKLFRDTKNPLLVDQHHLTNALKDQFPDRDPKTAYPLPAPLQSDH